MNSSSARPRASRIFEGMRRLAPGLVLSAAIAAGAMWLRTLPGFGLLSPLILAFIVGMLLHPKLGTRSAMRPGIAFAARPVLRAAIVLLGLQLTLAQVLAIGGAGLVVIVATLAASLFFTIWLGRTLGVDSKLTQLIATGTSICGASAVVAANSVARAPEEDVAYALAVVTLFGTAAMLSYPLLMDVFGLEPLTYGLWVGASVHEVAQVVGAAFQGGQEAGQFGTVSKLARVIMLAPVIIGLGLAARRHVSAEPGTAVSPVPWFVVGFIGLVALNSTGIVPGEIQHLSTVVTPFLLAMALAAIGLATSLRKLIGKGWRPLLLGAGAWIFIAAFSLAAIRILY